MAMLLGAAKHLAATRNFNGTAVLIFQPAEEGGGGGRVMLEEGLLERFGIQEVYAMHNRPDLPIGHFATRGGALLASADRFVVEIEGNGGHAAKPHTTIDPVLVAAQMTVALQSIVSRSVDPLESAVLSVTMIKGGTAMNAIASTAEIAGTIRSLKPSVRSLVEARFRTIVDCCARMQGAQAKIDWRPGYPVTINDEEKAALAHSIACDVASPGAVTDLVPPQMGAEDFSYMLEKRPGALVWIGNGASAGLHHPDYDFNDEALPYGISFWVALAEQRMCAA
jgi:hippurate hydrolase